jgi:hypothetical protein
MQPSRAQSGFHRLKVVLQRVICRSKCNQLTRDWHQLRIFTFGLNRESLTLLDARETSESAEALSLIVRVAVDCSRLHKLPVAYGWPSFRIGRRHPGGSFRQASFRDSQLLSPCLQTPVSIKLRIRVLGLERMCDPKQHVAQGQRTFGAWSTTLKENAGAPP